VSIRKTKKLWNHECCLKRRPRKVREASLGLRWRQHCQFFTLQLFIKSIFLYESNETK